MDENIYDEIFEGLLRSPDLTIEMPWMLRHSLENFQEMRLTQEEKGREQRAHTPFEPMRQPCSLHDLPSRAEELEFGSDTISIPPECSIDNQNSPFSSPISDKKSTRSESATWELPIPAVLPLPAYGYPDTEGAKPGEDLPTELEKPQSSSADGIISRRASRHDGRHFWISTPSLGVMLESVRTTSSALSSVQPHSYFGYPDSIKSDIVFDGELEEKNIKPDASTFRLQKVPSLCLHRSISDPGLGIRFGATKALSVLRSSFLETLPLRNVQEKLPQCITTNILSGETKDSSSLAIRDCPSITDEIPETPVISVVEPSNASEKANCHEHVSCNEKVLEIPISPPNCDETSTEGPIDESAPQSGKHDESPSRRHEELGREGYQEPSTETEQAFSAVHVDQPAPDDPPCNSTPIHETNASSASVDEVHDRGKALSKRRPKKILRRVPVAPGGPSEKVVVKDSRVNRSSLSHSPLHSKCVNSGAAPAQAQAGKSEGVSERQRQSSNETLRGPNTAKNGLRADIDHGARSSGGSGTGTNPRPAIGDGGGAGAGTITPVGVSGGHHGFEVDASRAEMDPASPRPNRKFILPLPARSICQYLNV